MRWDDFLSDGGLDRIRGRIRQSRRVRAARNVTGALLEDIVQDAILRLYQSLQDVLDECPESEDIGEFLVNKAVNYGIDAARLKKNGFHVTGAQGKKQKGKVVRHDSIDDASKPLSESRLGTQEPKVLTGGIFGNMDAQTRKFMHDLYMARPDLFDAAITCLYNETGKVGSVRAKELRRARSVWDESGRIPGKPPDGVKPDTRYHESFAIPADADILEVIGNTIMWTIPAIAKEPPGIVRLYLQEFIADADENGNPINWRMASEKLVSESMCDGFKLSPKYALVA